MKSDFYSSEGKVEKTIELPNCFSELIRRDLIKRAVLSDESKLYQPKGSYILAGLQTSAVYKGRKEDFGSLKNRGRAKLPREVRAKGQAGRVKRVPSAVTGRRAHPPKVEKVLVEKMNKKEYKKALKSALSATAQADLVKARGHIFSAKTVPLVVDNFFEELKRTKDVLNMLEKLGLIQDVVRSKKKTKSLTGTRKTRTKSKYVPKSVLILVKNGAILKSARNISGVNVVKVSELKVKDLAPGALPGRLTIISANALEELKKIQ